MTVSFHLQQNIDYVIHISETILYNQFIISRINTLLCTKEKRAHVSIVISGRGLGQEEWSSLLHPGRRVSEQRNRKH